MLILDKLQKRGWQLPNIWYLCGYVEESIHHILLHCLMVNPLWEIAFVLIGVSCDFPKTVKEALLSWRGLWAERGRLFGTLYTWREVASVGKSHQGWQ